MLCEQLAYNLLSCPGLLVCQSDDPVWDHSTFSKNLDRLLESELRADCLMPDSARLQQGRPVMSITVTTLIEAWASLKSVRHQRCRYVPRRCSEVSTVQKRT